MLECSRYIHLNPNRSRMTRPAERYRWSSYRNYIGAGPACVPWVAMEKTMEAFNGDRGLYREWIESGKGEKAISPFERAAAGLVLGSQALVDRVKGILAGRPISSGEPSLMCLSSACDRPLPELIETRVREIFTEETPRRRRTLRYYALRKYSSLGVSQTARRCGCSPAAISWRSEDWTRRPRETET